MSQLIKVILFDVGGTLRKTTKREWSEGKAFLEQILSLLEMDSKVDDFASRLTDRARSYQRWARETRMEASEVELWTQWMLPELPKSQVEPLAQRLNQLWRDAWTVKTNLPEASETILGLFRRGYRLGLVSNTTSSQEARSALVEMGVRGCFETEQLSCEHGTRKPDPSMLLQAAHVMGVLPEHCVYVGDRLDRDVIAARSAGFAQVIILRDPLRPDYHSSHDLKLAPDGYIDHLSELLNLFPVREVAYPELVADAALSTMWAQKNFAFLGDFFEAARRMGFAQVELNHAISSEMLSGIALEKGFISNVHEPCPADISANELKRRDWLMSSVVEDQRRHGVDAIRRSIDLAEQVGAQTVVVHTGQIPCDLRLETHLRYLVEHGQGDGPQALAVQAEMTQERSAVIAGHFAAVQKSLGELLEHAAKKSVRLGLENRFHYTDIPLPDEMEALLGMAGPAQLGMVFDVGHAQVLDRLGFVPFREWLERFAGRIMVTHLHDVDGVVDHRTPRNGQVDFPLLMSYLPETALRTFELSGSYSFEKVRDSLTWMVGNGWVKTARFS